MFLYFHMFYWVINIYFSETNRIQTLYQNAYAISSLLRLLRNSLASLLCKCVDQTPAPPPIKPTPAAPALTIMGPSSSSSSSSSSSGPPAPPLSEASEIKNVVAEIVLRCYQSPLFGHVRENRTQSQEDKVVDRLLEDIRQTFEVRNIQI